MKRYGNIYHKIYDMDNLLMAHKKARKDKAHYNEVQMVDENPRDFMEIIQSQLQSKLYYVDEKDYKMFKKMDKGKEREIYKLEFFPHRITQWAIMLQIQPMLEEALIHRTYASLPKRGIHKALKQLDKDLKDEQNTQYCLKLDIKKFYPSVNQVILKQMLRKKFKDKDLLWLLDLFIDSMGEGNGIPIGSLLSQWLGNFYLTYFDHWLREKKGVKYSLRYCDDIIILHESKDFLHQLRKDIDEYLSVELDLTVKENWQVFPTRVRGVDFVGYRHFGDYTILRKSTAKTLKRKMSRLLKRCENGQKMTYSEWCSINSYNGWIMWCNGHNLSEKYIKPLLPYADEYYKKNIKSKDKKEKGEI